MSARRLAIRQPDSFALSAKAKKEITSWTKKYPKGRERSAMIPALWIAQKDAGGWLPELALRAVGDMLGMAYIRVYEVATFYTMFNLEPVGVHHIQLCGTTPCWLRGANDLKAVCEQKIGPKGSISADGKLSWIEVECLGACANAPMVQISNGESDHYYEDLTADSMAALLDDLAAGRPVKEGPVNSRHTSEPEGGAKTLIAKGLYKAYKAKKLPNTLEPIKAAAAPKAPAKSKAPAKPKPAAKAKPKVLYTDGPTDGAPDDLKKIKGIGPKFEGDLNSKGIYYFRQIGAWKKADIKMVDALIDSFPGRIERDEWVKQAKFLAKNPAAKNAGAKKAKV